MEKSVFHIYFRSTLTKKKVNKKILTKHREAAQRKKANRKNGKKAHTPQKQQQQNIQFQ